MSFLFSYGGSDQKYNLGLTGADVSQVQMATWIQAPPKPLVSACFPFMRCCGCGRCADEW
jgi:hypothetical protein